MENEVLIKILFMVLTSFLTVVLITPFIKRVALHIGAMDIPNERKVHKEPIPRLGGLGIFIGFLVGYMFYGETTPLMNSILIGSFIIVITGVIDDIKSLRSSTKFFGQLFAALVVAIYGDLLLKNIDAFGIHFNFGILTYPVTVFFILGCINCLNFIDGLDGLSSGISSIYFLTIGIIAIIMKSYGLDFVITFVMLGSTLGFLIYNFNPASIFAGDSGSMFMGFIISVIALLGFKNVTLTSLLIPLLILAIPILDVLFAILRRTFKGESISSPDKFHIHHQLLHRNLSQKSAVLLIYLINILFSAASIFYILKDKYVGYFVYGILFIVVVMFITKTNVIIDFKKKK